VENMVALMEDLLTLARVGQVERPTEPLDTEAIIHEVVGELTVKIAQTGITVVVESSPNIRIPKTFLTQTLDNLIGNALRYAGPEGSPIEVGGSRKGGRVRLYVRDHGPGIPEQERDRIFEAFYRGASSQKFPGTGVGLATVLKIARLYGGNVWVEETPGGGSTFWVEMVDVPTAAENEENSF
jgi:signal transduction histidine kinase